jgi:hypothetical protein
MISVSSADPDHPAEFGPLVVDRPLNERGDRVVNPHESLAAFDEVQQRLPQFGILEQNAQRVVEADRIELCECRRTEHLDVVAEHHLKGTAGLPHLFDRVVGDRNRRSGGPDKRLAIAHRQVGDQKAPRLARLGRCLPRNRFIYALPMLWQELLSLEWHRGQHRQRADERRQKTCDHGATNISVRRVLRVPLTSDRSLAYTPLAA